MEILKKIYDFIYNSFAKIPIYLRGIVIFAIFVVVAILLNKITEPTYYYGNEDENYMMFNRSNNQNNLQNIEQTNDQKQEENIVEGSVKSNLKISAPIVKKDMYSRRRKKDDLPDSLKYFWNDNVFGSDSAPITIVEFSSYNCPYCITFQNEVLNLIKANYIDTGKVRYVKKIIIQKDTLFAVMLPYCVSSQNVKYNIISSLYKDTGLWLKSSKQKDELRNIAINNGFTKVSFERCISDSKLANTILKKQKTELAELNVNSTPTLFINGTRHKGDLSYENLSKIIDEEYNNYINQ